MVTKEIEVYKGVKGYKFKPYERKAQYHETDQMGVIHHANYIKWLEEARIDLLDQMGLSYKQMEEMDIISPVLAVDVEYKSMVKFNDEVIINVKITEYNGIKMTIKYVITDKKTGELRTFAKTEHCFLNASGKPISLKRIYPEIDTKFFQFSGGEKK